MRALVDLLNARAMLRALDENRTWPQRRIAEGDEAAVAAAHRQLHRSGPFDRASVDATLAERYVALENRRERLRRRVFDLIEGGLEQDQNDLRALAAAARSADDPAHLVAAIDQLLGEERHPGSADRFGDQEGLTEAAVAEAFAELVRALRERNEGDENGDGTLDRSEAEDLWQTLAERLRAEYGFERGRHARLMNGAVDLATRRQLQLGFNRPESNPSILVAQSLVGREGLNLHRACRIVILLHPEWNPGIVEQQIGRVDRVGSHWARMLQEAPDGKHPMPRIEVRPVIFDGTYDAHHWNVLLERWDDLRAQLHGTVVPYRERVGCAEGELAIIESLDRAAPDFFPPRRAGA
ncbi:helicase-related protein [Jiella pelagia]|uniref:Helicase-related protein n=1 Tax=Jiella pelagia TaxID=2986949 RepID=A0ABY7C438_9HYPH|nr:helicase-related protein [Jiella pelagia]WAP70080.1 helicase-related protein [Jiella pelagia]